MCLLASVWVFRWENWSGWVWLDQGEKKQLGWRIRFEDDFLTHAAPGLGWLEGLAPLGQLTTYVLSTELGLSQDGSFWRVGAPDTQRESWQASTELGSEASVSLLPHSVGYKPVIHSRHCRFERRAELCFLRGEWHGHTAEEHVGWEMLWPFSEHIVCLHSLGVEGKT